MLGKVSRIRVSSMTRPSSSGTLKSTRMKTRRSLSGRSRIESLGMESTPSFDVGGGTPGVPARPEFRWRKRTPSLHGKRVYSPLAAIRLIRSRTREEYPHSLSYHEITLTQLLPTTSVIGASTMDERE